MIQTQIHREDSHPGQPLADGISAEQVNQQMELILDSKHLRQARSLEKFLRYVVAKKLAGAESELKEYTIGVDVFQRGGDYDPRKDAVVRVQASVLRKRLASYYHDEGALDEIVIEIPKGHYVPQFYCRSFSTDVAMAAVIADVAPAGPMFEKLALPPAPVKSRRPSFWFVAMTFVLGLLTAFTFQHWMGKRISAEINAAGTDKARKIAVDPAYLPLWEKFLEPGVENILAYGTPQFFVGNGLYLRDVQVNSPSEADSAGKLLAIQKTVRLPLRPTEVYTGVGETHGVHLLTRFFDKVAGDLRVARSRMVGWGELRNANVIFLSSMRFHTLAKDLPYQSDFAVSPGVGSKIINLHPRAGEPAAYGGEYAVITVWPGKLQQRRILILSGITTWATLAAAEYVTDPEYLRQLNQNLEQCRTKSGHAHHTPFFQVLLRTEVKDNQPISISYVTHHDFEILNSTEPAMAGAENVARLSAAQK